MKFSSTSTIRSQQSEALLNKKKPQQPSPYNSLFLHPSCSQVKAPFRPSLTSQHIIPARFHFTSPFNHHPVLRGDCHVLDCVS